MAIISSLTIKGFKSIRELNNLKLNNLNVHGEFNFAESGYKFDLIPTNDNRLIFETDFPKFDEAKKIADVYARLKLIEDAMAEAIISHVGCLPKRFIAYFQPYEFEGLLFSEVNALIRTEPNWKTRAVAWIGKIIISANLIK